MMIRCPHCSSFVPVHADAPATCPECGASPTVDTTHAERPHAKRPLGSQSSLARRAANVALGVTTVLTLMACYGAPYETSGPLGCDDPSDDLDGDGYCGVYDCDERDPTIHVFAPDPEGDGIDSNCDGVDGFRGDAG